MPNAGRKRVDAAQRRVLELLAGSSRGVTKAVLLAHGFRQETLAVLGGLATVASETLRAGGTTITSTAIASQTLAERRSKADRSRGPGRPAVQP